MSDKSTSSLVVDISKLREAVVKAEKAANAARAEFRKTTAGMDNWSKSTEGLNAKIKQLNTSVEAEKLKLESLEAEYKQIVEKEGESSAAAKAHQVKIDNQTASVIRAEKELQKYKDKLSDLESDYSKATQEISKQEDELEALKKEYSNIILTQDKSSEAAQEVAAKIGKLSTELQENKKALENADSAADEFDNTLEKVDDSAEEAGDGFTVMKGALANLISRGIEAAASKLVDLGKEAINCFNEVDDGADIAITKTGAIGESAKDIKNSYKGVASQVTGDFTDIGSAVGEVNTRLEFTGDKLTDCSTDFVKFAKVNDTDVTSAVRLVSRAMGDAGIEADNYGQLLDYLTVAGQKSGVSIDTLTEDLAKYGAPMRALGLDTKNSIALFSAWEKSGVNVQIAFSGLKKAISNWGKEGKDSRKEFQKTLKEIKACPSLAKATTKAIDIFGAKAGPDLADAIKEGRFSYEDMIEALDNSKGSLKSTYDSIEDGGDRIKVAMQKAKFKVADFAGGIINKYEPQITKAIDTGIEKGEKAVTWVIKNSDSIIGALKPIGITIATVFAVDTVAKFGNSLGTIVSGLNKIKGASKGLGALSAVAITLGIINDNAIKAGIASEGTQKLTDAQQKSIDTAKDLISSYDELEERRDEEVDKADSQVAYYDKLREKLDKIVDKNGKVKKGYEDRATFITSTLNDALGSQLKIEDGFITNYQTQRTELKKLIDLQKAKSNLSANEELYNSAIKDEKTLKDAKNLKYDELQKQNKTMIDTYYKLISIQGQSIDQWAKENKIKGTAKEKQIAYNNAVVDLQNELWGQYEIQQDLNESYKVANERYLKNQNTIKNYENLSTAIASGSEKKISNALLNIKNNFISYKNATKDMLSDQVENTKSTWESLAKAYENGEAGVTKKAVNNAKTIYNKAVNELDKFEKSGKKAGNKGITGFCKGMNQNVTLVMENGQIIAKAAKRGLESVSLVPTGKNFGEGFIAGLTSTEHTAEEMTMKWGINRVKDLNESIESHSPSKATTKTGIFFSQGFINGIKLLNAKAKAESKNLGGVSLKALMLGVDNKSSEVGESLVTNFTKGINSQANNIVKTVKTLITNSIPKGGTKGLGEFFIQSFLNGIKSLNKQVKAESKNLGGASLKGILLGIDDGKFSKVGEKLVKHFTNGINSQASNIVKTVKNLINNSIPKGASRIEKAKKEFAKVAEQLTDSFTKSFEKGASKAVKKVEKAFNSISEKYQDKYDEIAQKQEDLQSTLSDYGSLFERDEDGNIKLSNLNEQINYLKTYDSNLKALKSKVSSDLMGVITSMSAEDGADLAAKLLSLSPEELKAFDTAYLEKQKISSQIAKDYYKSEVQSLKDNFTKAINKQLKTLKKDLKEVGKQSVEGFIKGFKSKNSDVSDTVEAWANSIVKTVKKKLKIKSPSRVFRYEVAGNIVDGFIKGIATRTRSAVNTMKEFSNKMTDSANISIGSAKRGMMLSSSGTVNNNSATYNFYQTNNSPKPLSRLEIYRQSRNLLNFKAGLKGA